MASSYLPNALKCYDSLASSDGTRHGFFLDYDGTLTPIVNDPEKAILSEEMRLVLFSLCAAQPVSIVSGRCCEKLRAFIGNDNLYLAGSHGLDIQGPTDYMTLLHPEGQRVRACLMQAKKELDEILSGVAGYQTEDNLLCISAHYRMVSPDERESVHAAVQQVLKGFPTLLHKDGKMVHELRPAVDWHKGKAVEWLLARLNKLFPPPHGDDRPIVPIYLGDDVADEEAFISIQNIGGIGIKVSDTPVYPETTAASWQLRQEEVVTFLGMFRKEIDIASAGD